MGIAENIREIKESLPEQTSLVAVSKFHPVEAIREAYDAGQRIFGESRAQELKTKRLLLPDDIEWHFIGQLQSNKVKDIAPFIHTIQSVDSLKLIKEIESQAAKYNRPIHVLLEIHIAQEESKTGFTPEECRALLDTGIQNQLPHVRIGGLMAMASLTEDTSLIRKEFKEVYSLFKEIKRSYFAKDDNFNVLSMGMSSDYEIAVSEGSTMIRVGSHIFGERE